ncbi:hypothetical protein MU1_21080 [Paenibacillus glycanilyticus]|uniref:Uncharacterized protein n=1 Tax=Paenibacillus glycanilyticus TaxID=126569 RepID=A0ABQ6GBZ8_9BACL|nr:hypothetical protein MU1_21080 [Paenibacillus glycanilyticus]
MLPDGTSYFSLSIPSHRQVTILSFQVTGLVVGMPLEILQLTHEPRQTGVNKRQRVDKGKGALNYVKEQKDADYA